MRKELGKISSVYFGMGGYQDSQFGIWFYFSMQSSGVGDGRGVWAGKPSSGTQWTIEDKQREMGVIMLYIETLLNQAKVDRVERLKNIPVEITFEGQALKEWRILTEVI